MDIKIEKKKISRASQVLGMDWRRSGFDRSPHLVGIEQFLFHPEGGQEGIEHRNRREGAVQRLCFGGWTGGSNLRGADQFRGRRYCSGESGGRRCPRKQGRCNRETEQFESRPGDSECRKRTCRKAGHASQYPDFDGAGPTEQQQRGTVAFTGCHYQAPPYQHQEALHKEELNSREEYLKAKEDYDLAVKKHALISKRLKKDAQLRRSQMEQMGDNLEAMQKNVQLVRQRKEKLNIRSTISGEIGLLDVELGQSIQAGQKIGVINDLSDFKVQAQVDEHYIDRVKPGLTATFDQNGKHYLLQVRKVYPEVRDGRFRIDFIFKGVRPGNIRTGQTYYVDLQLGQSKQAIIIPKGTFYSVTGGQWIFVLDKSGKKAYRRKITIGRQNPQYYEVIEGLEPGEQVIVSGYEAYKDNDVLVFN